MRKNIYLIESFSSQIVFVYPLKMFLHWFFHILLVFVCLLKTYLYINFSIPVFKICFSSLDKYLYWSWDCFVNWHCKLSYCCFYLLPPWWHRFSTCCFNSVIHLSKKRQKRHRCFPYITTTVIYKWLITKTYFEEVTMLTNKTLRESLVLLILIPTETSVLS